MKKKPRIAEILTEAKALIPRGKWVRGMPKHGSDKRCAAYAVEAVAPFSGQRHSHDSAMKLLADSFVGLGFRYRRHACETVIYANDEATHKQVMSAFDLAIAAAKGTS